MRVHRILILIGVIAAVAVWLNVADPRATAESDAAADARSNAGAPVVLELFTSQGCVNCPPADVLLSAVAEADTGRGAVIPLAYHVDYWNRLGWRDPFSRAAWTARQGLYARGFASTQVYTPQLIVNGRSPLVGNNKQRVLDSIAAARARPARADLDVSLAPGPPGDGTVDVSLAAHLTTAIDVSHISAMVAVVESGFETAVPRGENAGRTLRSDYVVRRLERAFGFDPRATPDQSGSLTIAPAADWDPTRLHVVAFLQDPAGLEIYTGAMAPWPPAAD